MRKTLPARYYLTHFHEFLQFFDGANSALLTNEAHDFISAFRALDEDKQCLIARAANRKYAIIDRRQFAYAEINAPQQHLDALIEQGYFGPLEEAALPDIASALTKDAIIAILETSITGVTLTSKSKNALVSLLEQTSDTINWPSVTDSDYLVCRFSSVLNYLLFLYFGNTRGRLNQFSMRDLGIMRTRENVSGDNTRFENVHEASGAWHYITQCQSIPFMEAEQLIALAQQPHPAVTSVQAAPYRDRFFFTLGTTLLTHDTGLALSVLRRADSDEAKEKWLREAYKAGLKDEVKAALESHIENPPSDTFLAFAEDFYARKFHQKRTSVVTDMLRNASRSLDLDESQRHQVERGVMAAYRRRGSQSWRTENTLWRSLFGLTFWSLLFEQDTLVTEFDRRPQSLKHNTFYADFDVQIDALLQSLDSADTMLRHVTRMATEHYGKSNCLFIWHRDVLTPVKVLLEATSCKQVCQVLLAMAKDFHSLSDGFPDIMVLEDGALRFEEIKAPGDQIRRNQLVSIQCLKQAGFDVTITQVNWVRDPDQPYAVVDIETTGGNSAYHRVTEVGIAKVIRGEIVDTYQTLINPERRIPSAITRLTGISDDMVADAPVFAEVADAIDRFTADCVFVAHNVNFDYGFIKQEFARLERSYRRPKLCTVREMRRAVPGLPSYSLASLTAHYDITMERHHRALSDAKAAAALLNIVHDNS
ncbi:exonuclease domain-containing protein [Alteromonas sp. CYL-A6]|uniref:exonuclease domain-containing protein n=1 Tax=Alteromonas nitratireducens TaxID=3390813 RepID=UPI0034B70910